MVTVIVEPTFTVVPSPGDRLTPVMTGFAASITNVPIAGEVV